MVLRTHRLSGKEIRKRRVYDCGTFQTLLPVKQISMSASKTSAHHRDSDGLDTLELLYIVCDRFSHSLRTPLGVAMGLIDDLQGGYAPGADEIGDARSALGSMLKTLNSVKDITNQPQYFPERVAVNSVIHGEMFAQLFSDPTLKFEIKSFLPESLELNLDQKLLFRAVRSVLTYCRSRVNRFPDANAGINIQFKSPARSSRLEIILSCKHSPGNDFQFLSEVRDLRRICRLDQSADSLGLLFVDAVFQLHGGAIECGFPDPANVIFHAVV